jgi:ketosteroid isomerase-like protein
MASALTACAALPYDEEFARELSQRRQAEYRAAAHAEFQALVRRWADAVGRDDIDQALALYHPDAWTHLDYPAGGPELRVAVERWVREVDSVLIGPTDFDFSGDLAFGTVRLLVVPAGGAGRITGFMTLVIRNSGGDWRIRSQQLNLLDTP